MIQHDFRSDTVTRPTGAMREAMARADVGDDVFGDDPTVRNLEEAAADRLGKEAGLFFPTGTQSNLVALMAHCERGDEYLVGQLAHCYRWEAGGAAVLGSIQPQPIAHRPDGTLDLAAIEAEIKPDDPHHARTRLLALENTLGGRVLSLDYVREACAVAERHGLARHLDGARLFNASVALGQDIALLAQPFDSVSLCLSKGLGAPLGSVLVGDPAFIVKARRLRKMVGGGMRQVGVVAAAGLYALENNVERLAEDHALARKLAEGIGAFSGLEVTAPDTNIVFVDIDTSIAAPLAAHLAGAGIGITSSAGGRRQRWVTHMDVDAQSVGAALAAIDAFFAKGV
ncbi:L-allo-threonine aldolase (plasmid) [Sinorhizobium americanum]|uniref:L-allo-threonine aldolase n=3 Tax=Sinorhizobium americanum TaxID=194963 RepID=A0A1L3LWD6_9HYPH|nr:low-specificity L-threonine aldolase [Sinorhizobium americanum]APG94382.1 L-allo-threonine aldolase [Sinorhizobium americanum]OAP44461.1 threonine aldolase [Sinorhizobium americanum]